MEKIFLVLHAMSLLFVIITVGMSYRAAINWIRGKIPMLDSKKLLKSHHRTWLGISLMLVTGFGSFWSHHAEFLAKWQFHLKMGFIVVLIINSYFINRVMKIGTTSTWKSLTPAERLPIYISTAIATLCWVGILTAALFIGIDK